MRRRWFRGAKPGALLTRGGTACTPAATCPAINRWHPPPRTVPRDSLAPGDQKPTNAGACGQPVVPDAARLALCRSFTGGAIASLDKDEPVTWMQHEDLCSRPVRPVVTGSRRSG
jgi:hypothetical protein